MWVLKYDCTVCSFSLGGDLHPSTIPHTLSTARSMSKGEGDWLTTQDSEPCSLVFSHLREWQQEIKMGKPPPPPFLKMMSYVCLEFCCGYSFLAHFAHVETKSNFSSLELVTDMYNCALMVDLYGIQSIVCTQSQLHLNQRIFCTS